MYGNSPYGSPVLGRGMFQPQVSPQFQQMLQMRDNLRMQRQNAPMMLGRQDQMFQPQPAPHRNSVMRMPQPDFMSTLSGNSDMGTPFDSETFDGEARPIEPFDGRQMIGTEAPQETSAQLGQVQQALTQMQQNQQALANHLGAGSQMANNQRQLELNQRQVGGLAGLLQPQRIMTQGPESFNRSIYGVLQ